MKIRKQLLLPMISTLAYLVTTTPSQSHSPSANVQSRSFDAGATPALPGYLLVDGSSGPTYTPGQPIKLHDYGTGNYGKSSSGSALGNYSSSSTAAAASTTAVPASTTPASTTVATPTAPASTSTAADSDSTSPKPSKRVGLGKLFNVLTNTILGPGLAAPTSIAAPNTAAPTTIAAPNSSPSAVSAVSSIVGRGGRGGGGGGAAVRPNGELANEIRMAQLHEQQGQYYNAAQEWWYSYDLATGGMGYKDRNEFTLHGTVAPGLTVKDLYKRALTCHVYMDRNYRTTHNTNGMNPSVYENIGSSFTKDLSCLEMSDPDNATWYYLSGVNWVGATDNPNKYVHAYTELSAGLSCKQGLTPTLKQKIEVLREHIRMGAALEMADLDRAKYENMIAQVQNIENPTITIYRDRDTGRVVDVTDSSATLYKFYYPMMKDMIKNDYPQFKGKFSRLVAYCRSRPNNAVAIPPFGPDDEAAHYISAPTEQKAFGPVEYKVGNFI